MTAIREPAVAGQFYPDGADELETTIKVLFDEARDVGGDPPKALIVPHAGYIYSGSVAAAAYAGLRRFRDRYRRVVMLGPCHRYPVRGLALSGAGAFRTPLGDVPIDQEAVTALQSNTRHLSTVDAAHALEHCLEVQLPFLQLAIGRFSLVPLVVGDVPPAVVSEVIDMLWGGPETLIVISSDLSHYLNYTDACARDRATSESIENFEVFNIGHDDACGATPIGGLLLAAERRGMRVSRIELANSGDTAGDRSCVVGYGAWSFTERAD